MAIPLAVLGGGSFGTCLATLCAREHDVTIWARDPEIVAGIERDRRNPRYLPDVALPQSLRATGDLAEALTGRELVICAVPSHGVRDVMTEARPHLAHDAVVVSTVKGLEQGSLMRMDQVLAEVLGKAQQARTVFLSGPSFAREVADEKPTVVTLACGIESYAISVQESISCPWFRCYTHTDVVGTELGGALKNVIAIAVGLCDGLGFGQNARAGVMTRGLREITRLGVQQGADPLTFLGLAGMGDLVLTCTGDLSRNRRVGLELGKGHPIEEITRDMKEVAEGIRTTRAVCELADREGVEMPIAQGIRKLLDGELPASAALEYVMSRQLRNETE